LAKVKKVYIEISNVCHLKCPFCPEGVRDKKFMGPELFKKIVREVSPFTEEICFHLMGEPLLHPEFDSYVAFCNSIGVRINLTTNGLLLDPRRTETLLNPAVKQINFSLQSFEANFPERDNSHYLKKIFDFTERALRDRPDLYINYRLWNVGAEKAAGSNDLLLKKIKQGLHVECEKEADRQRKKSVKLKGRVYLHFDHRFQWPHPRQRVRSAQGFCHGLSSHFGILADGTVVPCCLDKDGLIPLGKADDQKINAIIQGPRARAIRQGFQKGILVEDLCQKCTFISRFDKKGERLKRQKNQGGSGEGGGAFRIRGLPARSLTGPHGGPFSSPQVGVTGRSSPPSFFREEK
jgi:sulfatase maturation enzyme AslB (radical SAM superfamily)